LFNRLIHEVLAEMLLYFLFLNLNRSWMLTMLLGQIKKEATTLSNSAVHVARMLNDFLLSLLERRESQSMLPQL
jgi:hypothetical protein